MELREGGVANRKNAKQPPKGFGNRPGYDEFAGRRFKKTYEGVFELLRGYFTDSFGIPSPKITERHKDTLKELNGGEEPDYSNPKTIFLAMVVWVSDTRCRAHDLAVDKEFVRRAFGILQVDSMDDRELIVWAEGKYVDYPEHFDEIFCQVLRRLLIKLRDNSPSPEKLFNALENIYEEMLNWDASGKCLMEVLDEIERVPDVDLEMVAKNMSDYAAKEASSPLFHGDSLMHMVMNSWDPDLATCRVLMLRVSDLDSPSRKRRNSAKEWLAQVGAAEGDIQKIRRTCDEMGL